jgi:hypothetical protein
MNLKKEIMTPEEQRIAIAEACGWTFIPSHDVQTNDTPRTVPERWELGDQEAVAFDVTMLPDYLNDLNAMHEAEKILTYEQRETFVAELANTAQMKRTKATINSDYFIVTHATAAQRAEAFLRVLDLWKD